MTQHYSLVEWAADEVDRLLEKASGLQTEEEKADLEMRIVAVCDLAQRYGRSLSETAEPL